MAYALYRGTRLGLALQEALGEMEEYEQISPNVRSAVLRKFDEVNACFYFFQRILLAIKFKTQTSVRFLRGSSSCVLSRVFSTPNVMFAPLTQCSHRQCARSWRRRWTADLLLGRSVFGLSDFATRRVFPSIHPHFSRK